MSCFCISFLGLGICRALQKVVCLPCQSVFAYRQTGFTKPGTEGTKVGASCIVASTTKLAGICTCDCCLHTRCIYNIRFTMIKAAIHLQIHVPCFSQCARLCCLKWCCNFAFHLINHGDHDSYLMRVLHTDSVACANSMRSMQT